MVGLAQPLCLSASETERRRYDSTMNVRRKNHSVSLHYWGWTARPFLLRLTALGELFVLTSPFIERDYRHLENWQVIPEAIRHACQHAILSSPSFNRFSEKKRTTSAQSDANTLLPSLVKQVGPDFPGQALHDQCFLGHTLFPLPILALWQAVLRLQK